MSALEKTVTKSSKTAVQSGRPIRPFKEMRGSVRSRYGMTRARVVKRSA